MVVLKMNFPRITVLANNSTGQTNKDADLILRISNADEKALEMLYRHYYARLFRFIARITRQEDIIDEVINEVMYVIWKKACTYNHQCQPSTWIFGIAYNKARQAYTNSSNPFEESLDDLDSDSSFFEQNNCEIQQFETDNWLESALDTLSLDQRAVIELTYFQGLHYSEIAELMDCPENTVKTRMHHARKKLASVLNSNQ
jgi:RNA polymerase sigma-70 factor (ECF subfamily)